MPVARSSYKWENLYKKRTSVERVKSGLKKMQLIQKKEPSFNYRLI